MSLELETRKARNFEAGVEWSARVIERTIEGLAGASPQTLHALNAIAVVLREHQRLAAQTYVTGGELWSPDNSTHH